MDPALGSEGQAQQQGRLVARLESGRRQVEGQLVDVVSQVETLNSNAAIFKKPALWADSFYKSKCPYVCLSVCLFVRHTFSPRLTVFLPPLPEFQCPNFLDFWNLWGIIMERTGLRFENFYF